MKWYKKIGVEHIVPTLVLLAFGGFLYYYLLKPVVIGEYRGRPTVSEEICEKWVVRNKCDLTLHDCIQKVKRKCY